MAFASPGVSIKEIDLTPIVNVSDQNIGAVVIAAETGPVDTVTFVSSERELVDTFGRPNEYNYESWFAASTIIEYGGIAAVIRPTSSSITLNSSSDAGLSSFIIKSKFEYDNYTGTAFKFAGRSAGSKLNSLKVVAVDHGADQVITYSGTDPSVSAGDAIVIKNGATTVGTGWVYKVDASANKLYIVLNDSTKRVPSSGFSTYLITDNAGTPVTLVAAGEISAVDNTYYDTLEYAPGQKWRDVAAQPGTSSSVASKGGKFDEMHILVLDEDGIITGTPNTILEKFLFVSKAKDASTLDGSLVYFHSALAERSKYVFPGFSTGLDFIGNSKVTLEGVTNAAIGETNSSNKAYSLIVSSGAPVLGFSLSGGLDYDFASDAADIEIAVTNGYEILRDSEAFNDVDFLVPGRISADRAVKIIDIAESRRDCMAVISPRRSDVINSSTNAVKTENIIDFFSGLPSSSFAIFDSGYKYIYDKFNDTYRYVPCAADVAGLCINTTINSETWFSPAGYNRGNLRNATKLAYSPKQAERDRLYTNRINPIVSFPGQGIVLFGDKTALSSPSAFNRINVRRLFIELEKNIATFSKFQLFEINDEVTRSSFKAAVEPYLRGVQGRRGIYDFLVVCDETNNSADVIDRNEFNAEIYIKPARSINFITITFVATRTGVSFGELTQ
jgi:DNA/RNA endonuclease YhcR with UshA esterase domain